jgi:amino acid transporter
VEVVVLLVVFQLVVVLLVVFQVVVVWKLVVIVILVVVLVFHFGIWLNPRLFIISSYAKLPI